MKSAHSILAILAAIAIIGMVTTIPSLLDQYNQDVLRTFELTPR